MGYTNPYITPAPTKYHLASDFSKRNHAYSFSKSGITSIQHTNSYTTIQDCYTKNKGFYHIKGFSKIINIIGFLKTTDMPVPGSYNVSMNLASKKRLNSSFSATRLKNICIISN